MYLTKIIPAYENPEKLVIPAQADLTSFSVVDYSGLFIASPSSIVIFVLSLPLAPVGFLRRPSILRSLLLVVRPWSLLTLLFQLILLPLIMMLHLIMMLPLIIMRCRRSILSLLFIVLLDCLGTRLETVLLAVK